MDCVNRIIDSFVKFQLCSQISLKFLRKKCRENRGSQCKITEFRVIQRDFFSWIVNPVK